MNKAILLKRRFTYSIAVAVYCLLGFSSALVLARESSGYLASLGFIMIVFLLGSLIILLCLIGGFMLLIPDVRWCAPALLLSFILIPASYLISLKTMSYFGAVRYEHEQMTPLSSTSTINSFQERFEFKCPDDQSILPVNCLHNMQVQDVNRRLTEEELHQLCQVFIKAYLVTKKEYKQDYLLDPTAPIYQLFKTNLPEIKKEEGEGGVFLEKIYKLIEAKPEHQKDIKAVMKTVH